MLQLGQEVALAGPHFTAKLASAGQKQPERRKAVSVSLRKWVLPAPQQWAGGVVGEKSGRKLSRAPCRSRGGRSSGGNGQCPDTL